MLRSVRIQGFRCLHDVTLHGLGALHALVGPNDSGKSSLLRAIAAISTAAEHGLGQSSLRSQPFSFSATTDTGSFDFDPAAPFAVPPDWAIHADVIALRADDISRAAAPIAYDEEPTLRQPDVVTGSQTAAFLDWLLKNDRSGFERVEDRVHALFPAVRQLVLQNERDGGVRLALSLHGVEHPVPAYDVSEGLRYLLAFEALAALRGPRLFLVEEPETGLHPARIREVVDVLRALTDRGHQVLLTTHSPLVLNELDGSQITILTRDATSGTRATPMTATTNYAARAAEYSHGELWLAWSDGEREAGLVGPGMPLASEPGA